MLVSPQLDELATRINDADLDLNERLEDTAELRVLPPEEGVAVVPLGGERTPLTGASFAPDARTGQ